MELLGVAIFVALFAIGFFPMQRLRSRRATIISGILGLALVPIGLTLLRLHLSTTAGFTVFIVWAMLVGLAMTMGSAVRFYILGMANFTHRDRQIVTLILGVALAILMVAAFRYITTALD